MLKRFLVTATAMAASSIALAQGVTSVDLLEPGETTGTIPTNFRCVDVFADIATTDCWTAGGIRALAQSGATINYFDSDLNTPEPNLFNGGAANKFHTMLSKPRARDGAARFTNAAAAAAGAYDPTGPTPVTSATELSVAYFASPPESSLSPSFDGYIARLSVNINAVAPIPGADINNYANWGAGLNSAVPAGATVVLRSIPVGQPNGTAIATFDVPTLSGLSWALWYVPEPTSLALLALGGLAAIRRR